MEDPETVTDKDLLLSTCTALGGYEEVETPDGKIEYKYAVGDEALDLKRFIRYGTREPEKSTLFILAEFNLIEKDLVPLILTHANQDSAIAERFVLACVELIVPMTWPLDKDNEEERPIYSRMLEYHRQYKLALLAPNVLEAIVHLVFRPLSVPFRERSERDQTVIRLVLYLLRNLTAIPDLRVSPSATGDMLRMATMQERLLIRFCESPIMELLLTMASSSMDADSAEFNVMVLEIVHNILQHVNPKDVFLGDINKKADNANQTSKLSLLLEEENDRKRVKSRKEPTRHNRFGGSFTLQGWDGSRYVVHNPKAIYSSTNQLIDEKKKPDRRGQKRKERDEIGEYVAYRDSQALIYMKRMAQSFLESCFNDIEREDKKIMEKDHLRLYFTMKWFLEYLAYEHAAYHSAKERKEKEKQTDIESSSELFLPPRADVRTAADTSQAISTDIEKTDEPLPFDYDLVASAMDLRTFLLCLRRLRVSLEDKLWLDVQVGADCFKQMLLTLTAMASSPHEEYRQLADYIQGNIYHEQSTFDLFIDLIKRYRNQSLGYLLAVVQLTHVLLKMLEKFSKKQQVMFVRKKKSKLRKEKADEDTAQGDSESDEESAEERRERQIAYREHVFKFESLEAKYATTDVVRIYCSLLENYSTLKPEILICITTLFHRIMVKRKVEHPFFKLPVLDLFNRILSEYHYLPKSPAMSQLVQFIRYSVRQFFKRANEYPLLFVEALFKTTAVTNHLDQGDIDDKADESSDEEENNPSPPRQDQPGVPSAGADLPEELPEDFMFMD
ncbi:Topoisomerase 1-associated factor 1 [Apophysomyces ossiformis]|uniref:Topoisomerase 1-associated factor 1 n=1 Tax=Apophysomyces ossiformis TaxID=679940 RepID=A0A8H7BRR4_9FUNG|nr:Topoisomerase 1-associated factor 1 [Apophysomyces ossiformis]